MLTALETQLKARSNRANGASHQPAPTLQLVPAINWILQLVPATWSRRPLAAELQKRKRLGLLDIMENYFRDSQKHYFFGSADQPAKKVWRPANHSAFLFRKCGWCHPQIALRF